MRRGERAATPNKVTAKTTTSMSKPSERKRRKQKAREKAVAKRKHFQRERRRYALYYPQFVFEEADAPAGFVRLIRKAIQQIDLRDRSLFAPAETAIFKSLKQHDRASVESRDVAG